MALQVGEYEKPVSAAFCRNTLIRALKGFVAWTALSKFFWYQENAMILPVCLTLVYFLVPKNGASIIGTILALVLAPMSKIDLVGAVITALGAGMILTTCDLRMLGLGLVPLIFVKMAFTCHPLVCTVYDNYFRLFIAVLCIIFASLKTTTEEDEDEANSTKWDWLKAGVWMFLARSLTIDVHMPLFAMIAFIVIAVNVQIGVDKLKYNHKNALLCGCSLIGTVLGISFVSGGLFMNVGSAVHLKERREFWKALMLFCKLNTLLYHLPLEYTQILMSIPLLAYIILSLTDKPGTGREGLGVGGKKWLCLIFGVALLGRLYQIHFPKALPVLRLEDLRIENVPSEAAYLVQEDFEGLPLLRIGMCKHNARHFPLDLVRNLDLDVLVAFNTQKNPSEFGRILAEVGGFYFLDAESFSLISRHPIVSNDNSQAIFKVLNRDVKLIIMEKVNKEMARKVREGVQDQSTILLIQSSMLVDSADYHLIFRPSSLNPAIHSREPIGSVHDIEPKIKERNGMFFGHNNRALIPVNYGRLRVDQGEWHLSTWAVLPPKVIDADVKWRRLVEVVKTIPTNQKNIYWDRWRLPEKDLLCKDQKNREECPFYYHLSKALF